MSNSLKNQKNAGKVRLDLHLQSLYPEYSRQQIQSWIIQEKVILNGKKLTKPGTLITPDALLECLFETPKYVSRAGVKLEKAITTWSISIAEKTCLDAGISTGGFTDCLLQHGAKRVYGIDVGYAQVSWKVRTNPRVTIHERTNLRHLTTVGEPIDLISLDLSFISLLKVMDTIKRLLKPNGELITLIKPQFEAGKEQVESGGLITKPEVHKAVVEKVTTGITAHGFELVGVTESPILGQTGNKEFLAYFRNRQ